MLPPPSRYAGIEIATWTLPDGRTVAYLRRRFVPAPEDATVVGVYVVTRGERLDVIAARTVGDPEQFWRLCDSNRALHPGELERMDRRLLITLPQD